MGHVGLCPRLLAEEADDADDAVGNVRQGGEDGVEALGLGDVELDHLHGGGVAGDEIACVALAADAVASGEHDAPAGGRIGDGDAVPDLGRAAEHEHGAAGRHRASLSDMQGAEPCARAGRAAQRPERGELAVARLHQAAALARVLGEIEPAAAPSTSASSSSRRRKVASLTGKSSASV